MEVLKNFKDLQKLGVRNIAQYSAANVLFPVFFFPTDFTSSILSAMFTGVWPAREIKPRFGAALVRSAHACETRVYRVSQITH